MRFHYASVAVLVALSVLTIADAKPRCKEHPREINVLKSLLQETDYLDNVNLTVGPNTDSPAVMLDGSHGICVDNTSLAFQRQLHKYSCSDKKEFVMRACVKFSGVADGPILFLHSNGMTYLSLEVGNDDGGTIKISFVHDGEMRAISFPYTFTDLNEWHNISVIFNGRLVSLYINCNKVADQIIMEPDYCIPNNVMLNIGDNPRHTETFKGCLQDLIISFKEKAIIKQCPKAHTDCRFSAAYLKLKSSEEELRSNVSELLEQNKVMKQDLDMYRSMSTTFSCFSDGRQYKYGTFFWKNDKICFCSQGGTERCKVLADIERPDPPTISSDAMCTLTNGTKVPVGYLRHSSVFIGAICSTQVCTLVIIFGRETAQFSSTKYHTCHNYLSRCSDAPNWDSDEREAAQCCGYCTACQMQSDCPAHSTCLEDVNSGKYTCPCKDGFNLDDNGECIDLDECAIGRRDVGHYCPTNAKCNNTEGSFNCICPEGHNFIDLHNLDSRCEDIDECQNTSACPTNFICNNTVGSFRCECAPGYVEHEDHCIPHCDPPCKPGGQCLAGNVCSCPKGLHGHRCQNDEDECENGNHDCSEDATCVNFHGGYFCICKDGYHGSGKVCNDINECETGSHTCPVGSNCSNTIGSFTCKCKDGDCKDGCSHRGMPYAINSVRFRGSKDCTKCTCNNRTWTCLDVVCNCSIPGTEKLPCCSHCTKATCNYGGHEFDHSQQFFDPSNPCNVCRCRHGRSSCEDMGPGFVCPPELQEQSPPNTCKKCKVGVCNATNEGMKVDVNNSCSECTCENGTWICRKKSVNCVKPLCPSGKVITMGCCQMCEGSTTGLGNNQAATGKTSTATIQGSSVNEGDDDDSNGTC